jgi:hypothetical protein
VAAVPAPAHGSVDRAHRLRYCLISLLILLASVDYLCNYGVQFTRRACCSCHQPGADCAGHGALQPAGRSAGSGRHHRPRNAHAAGHHPQQSRILAAACRTCWPATSGRSSNWWPTLSLAQLQYLHQINQYIENEISRSNFIVDMMLASARAGALGA